MPLKSNQVVTMNFTLKDDDGNVLDSTQSKEPFLFISGTNQILPKLEEKVGEMLIGSKKDVVLQPEDGYGVYKQEVVRTINRSELPQDVKLDKGMGFLAKSPQGKDVQFFIKEIEDEKITVDFNHPLAGKALHFDLELVNLRDATPEELDHGHVHGDGGHHH
ncbi:MAG: peptidylprolyl isomerase [Ignavibacteriaceae bacterium]